MKQLKKLILKVLMVSVLISGFFMVRTDAATFNDINQSSVFLKQDTTVTCTLSSATMLVRRAAMASGNANWGSITESAMKGAAWINGTGLAGTFTYAGIKVTSRNFTYDRATQLKDLLSTHPEGIVIYDWDIPHAILVTDYTNGVFYCADPAWSVPKGRIPNSQATAYVANADKYWYVSSPSITLTQDTIPSISGANNPGNMTAGNSFSMAGTVSSSMNLTNVTAGCYDYNGTPIISKSVNPGTKSYNLANLNSAVNFANLPPGVYTYRVNASTSAGSRTLVENRFVVFSNKENIKSGTYYIRVYSNPECGIAPYGYSTTVGTDISLVAAANVVEQRFYIKHEGNGYYSIKNSKNGLYMDVEGASSAIHTNVIQYTGNGGNAQRWQILPTGAGYCFIPECAPANCLDIYNGEIHSSGDLWMFSMNLSNAQRFTLKSVDVKKTQKITASDYTKTIGDKSFTLNAKLATGNGKLSFSSNNKNVATVTSKGKVTLKGVGKATITITASGTTKYSKTTKKITVTVKPKKTSLSSVKSSSAEKITVKWKKGSSVSGYQIQYGKKSSFSDGKKVSVSKSSTSKTLSDLTGGKKYYVRIRTYKTVNGTKYYSSWSSYKSVTVKKSTSKKGSITLSAGSTGKTTCTLKAKTYPSSAKVSWSSSNKKIATVSSSGKVTAKGSGTATITAKITYKSKTYKAKKKVTVSQSKSYGSWSGWTLDAISPTSSKEVRTTPMYRYYCFYCPVCGGREPFSGNSDCWQYNLTGGDWREIWSPIPYSQANGTKWPAGQSKMYTYSLGDGLLWNFGTANLYDTAIGTRDGGSGDVVIMQGYSSRSVSNVYKISSIK